MNKGWREAMRNLVEGNRVRRIVAAVHHEGRRASRSEQRRYGHEKGGHVERVEHELRLA